jgi:hypothetical protein
VAESEEIRSDAATSKTAVVRKGGMMAKKTVRSTALRAGLPAVRKDFFFPFTQHLPTQRAKRASGTYWAILWSRLTALAFSREQALSFLPTSTVGLE